MKFRVGDRVVHMCHTKDHAGWCGYVVATETYTDGNGTRRWCYVRWIDPHGKVASEPDKFSADELEPAPC